MPSVAMSCLLRPGIGGLAEIRPQRIGHQRRQRQAGVDGVVLHLLDQLDRQVDVELLDLLGAHTRMLASYSTSCNSLTGCPRPARVRAWGRRSRCPWTPPGSPSCAELSATPPVTARRTG